MDENKNIRRKQEYGKQKYSKKYAKKIKKKLQVSMFSIAMVLLLIAGCKLVGLYMPVNRLEEDISEHVIRENKTLVNDEGDTLLTGDNYILENESGMLLRNNELQDNEITTLSENNDTITYIYTADDLVKFRDSVNAGNTYAGKTVYLMNDIDLITVCSSTLGSWEPIGATGTYFIGTFDGNYHTISNLYINSNLYNNTGLFSVIEQNAIISNVLMDNVYIYNNYSSGTNIGSIAGTNLGDILNCGVKSGELICKASTYILIGGISGRTGDDVSSISNCYNNANINATLTDGDYIRAGGICGQLWYYGNVSNCYNTGDITSNGKRRTQNGGIIGSIYKTAKVVNCYNTGKVSGTADKNYIGGIVGQSGESTDYPEGIIENSYCTTTSSAISYYYYSGGMKTTTAGRISPESIQTGTVYLGSAYAYDVYNKNGGYPVLAWQNETELIELKQKQAYIKTGENLQLDVVGAHSVRPLEKLENVAITDFTWKSSNEDIATVNENGLITGVGEGYTTIYGTYKNNNSNDVGEDALKSAQIYTMCIINVAGEGKIATPQIETGNGFTVVLKADGTVWTIGNNAKGQLGTGDKTGTYSNVLTQVQIDEDTKLDNVIKIAVGTDHVLAITKQGRVYAWGDNTYGELGQNNTKSSNYAKIVLGEDGTSYLGDIVDISAGSYGSIALDRNGNVYVWGNGSNGEIGNYNTESKALPTKTTIKKAIQVSMGDGHVAVLTTEGVVWSWGRNNEGQLGINCVNNTTHPMKSALDVTEISCGGYHTTIKRTDETVYAVGCYGNGRLGTGNTSNITQYAKVNLPNTVTETNKVKYIKSGIINTTILLTDGSIWETGFNLQGELGNGTAGTETHTFVQGLIEKETPIEEVLMIGRNNGNVEGSLTTGYGLNTAVILKNGDIYTTGDNTYGQIGDNTEENTTYYKRMGFAYLDYEDKTIEIDKKGYQIDINKLKYIQPSSNVYSDTGKYTLGEIKYTSLDTSKVQVSENGLITSDGKSTGVVKIRIEDITNGYETYITVIVNRLQNIETVTYIYNIEDLVRFRDSVNAGNNYAGKTVYVMADIDMSPACSETVGSWTPIGATGTYFAGTFDGNYNTISNLYINSNLYNNTGLFSVIEQNAIIRNVLMDNVYIHNNYSSGTNIGSIAGTNLGDILNCGVKSGEVICKASTYILIGGISGKTGSDVSSISNCYNNANINATLTNGDYIRAGGICGQLWYYGSVSNCYNTGNITTNGKRRTQNGGIIGSMYRTAKVVNCYNIGKISGTADTNYIGGIVGQSGESTYYSAGTIGNSYCTTTSNEISYYYYNGGIKTTTEGRIEGETLKNYASVLGKAYENDDLGINGGYPILWWQAGVIELNKKQAYIKAGENLQLDIVGAVEGRENAEKLENVDITDFTWSSSNEDIATVNENGLITGVGEGYTTIYGKHKEYENINTMCIINVAKSGNIANPQIETGNGFTVILKADGTVWMTGNEEIVNAGTGGRPEGAPTTDETTNIATNNNPDDVGAISNRLHFGEPAQIKINENTYLENVIKISAGTNHVLALTKSGEVYAWGKNDAGQLGIGDLTSHGSLLTSYAVKVTGEGGASTLKRIVDISAGEYGSSAINEFGWVYVWGNGTYGEMANIRTISSNTPVKTTVNHGISVSRGEGHVISQGQNGKLYTWGKNDKGQLGTGNRINSATVVKIADEITDITAGGNQTIVKDIEGNIYGTGQNTNGELGIGTNTNVTTLTKITIPDIVTGENNNTDTATDDGRPEGAPISKVKYIKAGTTNTTILLNDGTVWSTGINTTGELGNGENNNTNTFVQGLTLVENNDENRADTEPVTTEGNDNPDALTSHTSPLTSVMCIGRNNGGLNTVVILENGSIYGTGDNTYSQITNEQEEGTNYYVPIRYIEITAPEEIELQVGETRRLTEEEKTYIRRHINTYENDKEVITKLDKGEIIDTNIATYENEEIQAKKVGNTEIKLEEEKGKQIKIPIRVIDYNTGIEYIEVNGKMAEQQQDGTYIVKIKDTETEMIIKAQTTNEVSNIKIDEGEYKTHNTIKTITTEEKESIHEIKVQATNGEEQIHILKIIRVSGNTRLKELSVKTTEKIENEETGEIQTEEKIEIIDPLEDGTYYLKIERKDKIDIKAILEEKTSKVKIQNSKYKQAENEVTINTLGEKTTVTIGVIAEDGETENYTLILEKKSNDTSLKEIKSEEIIKQENKKIYVDEGIEQLELTLETNSKYASIKLLEEEEYSPKQITRTINLNQEIEEVQEGIELNIQIQAEDGTIENHTITIVKTGNANIKTVKIEGQEIINQKDTYTGRINIAQTAEIEITSQNERAKIEIIETKIGENEEEQEEIVINGIGIISTNIQIKENPQKYKIRVTSENGSETRDYELRIEQKSEETGITYVKIDGLTAIETEEGYTTIVTGKEKYPIQIKLTNEKAKVKIESQEGKTIIENQEGKLIGELEIEDSTTEEYKIIVTAENGNEKEYNLKITRISNNANLEYLKVDGKECQSDKIESQNYTIEISKKATEVELEAKGENAKAQIRIGENKEEIQITKQIIDISDITEDEIEIQIKVTAEDGKTTKTYNVKLIRTGTIITGRVTTENIEGKHKAIIRAYKTEEKQLEQIENKTEIEQPIKQKITEQTEEREIIEEVETEEDGRFEIVLEKGQSYDIAIIKGGYLIHTITNVQEENVEKGNIEINIGEIELIAGDVAESGEIEIDDLVDLNDNYGIVITEKNRETKGKYDLNGDGIIDILDRNILKKNYGKIAETIKWVKSR